MGAELGQGEYPRGIKISDQVMRDLERRHHLRRHDWHPEWNYTVSPASTP